MSECHSLEQLPFREPFSWIEEFYLVSQLFPLWPPFSQNMQSLFLTSWHPMPVRALLAFVLIDVHCILNLAGTWLRGRKSVDLVGVWLSDRGMMTSSAFNHISVFSFLLYPWREKVQFCYALAGRGRQWVRGVQNRLVLSVLRGRLGPRRRILPTIHPRHHPCITRYQNKRASWAYSYKEVNLWDPSKSLHSSCGIGGCYG